MANDLKFVDSVATSPTTLLDLNDRAAGGFWIDEFSAPPPSLRRDLSDAALTDGQLMSSSAYDNRTVAMALRMLGTADQTALAIQKLGRILNSSRSVLRWLPQGETLPVFFRVLRSPLGDVDEALQMLAQDTRRVEFELLADPAAYGLPESGTVTINNDPVAGSNPCFWDMPTIKGDLETPLFISTGAQTDLGGRVILAASSALRTGTQTAPFIVQLPPASGVSAGTFTTGSGDAAMSGGNYYRYTSTGAGAQSTALTWNSGVFVMAGNPIGDYRVFVRYRTSAPADGWTLMLSLFDATAARVVGAPKIPSGSFTIGWLDLGVFRFPIGSPDIDTAFNAAPASAGTRIKIDMTLPAGSVAGDTLDLDVLMFVPAGLDQAASNKLAMVASPALASTSSSLVLDGVDDTTYITDNTGQVGNRGIPSRIGGLPTVVPGCDNSLTWLRAISLAGYATTADSLTATTVLNWQYWPRYLYGRPAST